MSSPVPAVPGSRALRREWVFLAVTLLLLGVGLVAGATSAPGLAKALWTVATAIGLVVSVTSTIMAALRRELRVDVIAVLALAGCETSPRAPAPAESAPRVADPHEEKAPLQLSLEAASDANGVLDLRAHIDSPAGVSLPVELSVELPPGAKLVDGDARQSVPVPAGRTTRNFRIERGATGAPVKVVAHVVHPAQAWGIHAEKFYPEQPKSVSFHPAKAPPWRGPPSPPSSPPSNRRRPRDALLSPHPPARGLPLHPRWLRRPAEGGGRHQRQGRRRGTGRLRRRRGLRRGRRRGLQHRRRRG